MSDYSAERTVRAIRDRVYGKPCTQDNWIACRDHTVVGGHQGWLHPDNQRWLIAHQHPLYVDTSLQEVIDEAARLGLKLEARGVHLSVQPQSKITPEFRSTLIIFERELLAWLENKNPPK